MPNSHPTEILDRFEDLTPDKAREAGRDLDAYADELKRRAKALFAYADVLDPPGEPDTAPATEVVVDGADGGSGSETANILSDARERKRRKPAAPVSNKRPLVLRLIGERPAPGWSVAEIHSALIDRGDIPANTSRESIGVSVRRMYAKYHQLGKDADKLYTTLEHAEYVASDDGSYDRRIRQRDPEPLNPDDAAEGSLLAR